MRGAHVWSGLSRERAAMKALDQRFAALREADVSMVEHMRIATPYVAARPLLRETDVLDVGAGPGYGALLVQASGARFLVISDIEEGRLPDKVQRTELLDAISAVRLNAEALPFRPAFDRALLFEVLEHVHHPEAVLGQLRHSLRDRAAGFLLLTTPNREVRLLGLEQPWNDEHLREYSPKQLLRALRAIFPAVALLGVYGDGPWHDHYVAKWRPSLRRWARWHIRPQLVRWIPGALISRGASALRGGGAGRGVVEAGWSAEQPDHPVPADLDPLEWPFFVAGRTHGCLSMMAVCGDDHRVVQAAGGAMVEAFGPRATTGA